MYTNKGNRSSFHEDTCALSVKNARRDTYGRRHFCTKKLFNEGSFLLESKKKTKTYINKKRRKNNLPTEGRVRGNSDSRNN